MDQAGIRWGSAPLRYFAFSLSVAANASLVANFLGVFSSAAGPVFLSNLGLMLLVAGLLFIRLIVEIIPEEPTSHSYA